MYSKNKDDCYFYFSSSCTKGNKCLFRHCKQALGTQIVCSLWRAGKCFRDICKFRHMESKNDYTAIQCSWEKQPGGCRKRVFLHPKLRNGTPPDKITESPKCLNFKIKTLEEIRRERESKQGIGNRNDRPNPSLRGNKTVSCNGILMLSNKTNITSRSEELCIRKRKIEDSEQNRCSKFSKVFSEVVLNAMDKPVSLNGYSLDTKKESVKVLVPFFLVSKTMSPQHSNMLPATLMPPSYSSEDKENDDSILSSKLCKTRVESCELTPMKRSTFSPATTESNTSPVEQDSDQGCEDSLSTVDRESTVLDSGKEASCADGRMDRSLSVEDWDDFLNEAGVNVDVLEDSDDGDGIMLEIDQFLNS